MADLSERVAGRAEQLAVALAAVRERVQRASADAGRPAGSVVLVAVAKTWPAVDVVTLAGLGVGDFGENRDQEARDKVAAVESLLPVGPRPRWHFVGQLQTNKARSVASYADVVHTVDRPRLVGALGQAVRGTGRSVDVLVQVDLGNDRRTERGGAPLDRVAELADRVAAEEGLTLRGLMSLPPRGLDASATQAAFARLADGARMLQDRHPLATWISAGMSGDLELAVAAGATHVRIGRALFGDRGAPLG